MNIEKISSFSLLTNFELYRCKRQPRKRDNLKLVFAQFFRTKKTENVGNDVGVHGGRLSDGFERHLAFDDNQPGLENALHGRDTSKSKRHHLHLFPILNFVLSIFWSYVVQVCN